MLLPDRRAATARGVLGVRTQDAVLSSGDATRSLFRLCRGMSVPATTAVRRLAEYLAIRWTRHADPLPGRSIQDILGVDDEIPPVPATLRLTITTTEQDRYSDAEVVVSAAWDDDVLEQTTVAAFLGSLRALVTDCATRPETVSSELLLTTSDDTLRLLELGYGGTPTGGWYRTVPEAVRVWAERQPRRTAIRYRGTGLSFAELVEKASSCAAALAAVGVTAGDRVLLQGAQTDLTVVGMLACHFLGVGYVPLDTTSPVERLRRVAATTRAAACLWVEGPDPAAFLSTDVRIVPVPPADRGAVPPGLPTPSSTAYVLFSSGSTGIPKGIEVTHASLAHFCREITAAYTVAPDDRVLAFARPVFDVSVFEVFATLAAGARVVIPDADTRMDPVLLTEFIRTEAVTLAELPPALLPLLEPGDLPSLRLVSVGGEAVPGAVVGPWSTPGRELWNGYGPTETTVAVTLQRLTGGWTAPPPIGRPIPGCTAYVVDDLLTLRPRGAVGELCIAGPSLATGYVGDPARTAASFVELPEVPGVRVYRTGDLARWRGDGALDYLGRLDRQVKVNGFRVEPAEVEAALGAVHGIDQAVVEVVEVPGGGRALGALVVGEADIDPDSVLGAVREVLPPYAVPVRVVPVDAFPLTPNGKVDRIAVADLLSGTPGRPAGR